MSNRIAQCKRYLPAWAPYIEHPVAAAALAVQKVIEKDDLLAAVRMRGASMMAMLQEAFGRHAHVGDIGGRGLLLAIELVQDRETKQPFAPERKLHAAIKSQAMAHSLMVYPMGGTIDGQYGDHVLLAPPLLRPTRIWRRLFRACWIRWMRR